MKGVIVYFPWGGGGNLVKNIINLDLRFQFLDDQVCDLDYETAEERFNWLLNYYSNEIAPESWLPREWSIRAKMHARYYVNGNITYWDPKHLLCYDVHGGGSEIANIFESDYLGHYDRVKIEKGMIADQLSDWKLPDCEHIFLIPKDIKTITEIYNSKNPTINQLSHEGDLSVRRREAEIINTTMTGRLVELHEEFNSKNIASHLYTADELYRDSGYQIVSDIVDKLNLSIPKEYVKIIHTAWLKQTRIVYEKYFNKDLKI